MALELQSLFPVRKGERGLAAALFFQCLFTVGAFVAARAVRDALYLQHLDRGALADIYVVSACAVALVGLAYAPLARKVRGDRLATFCALLFAGLFFLAWLVEGTSGPWFFSALYVYVEVMGALTVLQVWSLANALFHAGEAKRLYGLIGSGGTLASVLAGFGTREIAVHVGARAVLLLCGALLLGASAMAHVSGRLGKERLFAKGLRAPPPKRKGASRVIGSGHLRTVAALVALTYFTTTLVDYEFKAIAATYLSGDRLAAFFGTFFAVVGMGAIAIQLFGTSKLLSRAGVILTLAVLPFTLGAANLTLALLPTLWAAIGAKGTDTLFRYTLNDATTQILYLPVIPRARASAKAFIDAVVKPCAIALAGLFLVVDQQLLGSSPFQLAEWAVGGCAAWGGVLWLLRTRYIRSLRDNLRSHRLDLASARYKVEDLATQRVLEAALERADTTEVLAALELLPQLSNPALDDRVEPLLEHAAPEVRIAALRFFAQRETVRHANSIFRRFEDPDSAVRAAAIDAFCGLGRDKAVRSVRGFLTDPDPRVRGAAISGMIRHGGLDGVLVAAESLKTLIGHPEPPMRENAARVLGEIGVRNFHQPVLELMDDPALEVRRAAIISAGRLGAPELVIPLIYKLASKETGADALDALCRHGPSIAPMLGKVLGNPLEDLPVRRGSARVLGRLGDVQGIELLLPQLGAPDESLRLALFRALSRLAKRHRLTNAQRRDVESALELELARARRTLAVLRALALGEGTSRATSPEDPGAAAALLISAVFDKLARSERRVFELLGALYPSAGMEQIHAGLRGGEEGALRRANALELLENLLERPLLKSLRPLLERGTAAKPTEEPLPEAPPSAEAALAELLEDENAWVRSCALHYAARLGAPAIEAMIRKAAMDPDPWVRETALARAVHLRLPTKEIATAGLRDESPVVRAWAEHLLGAA